MCEIKRKALVSPAVEVAWQYKFSGCPKLVTMRHSFHPHTPPPCTDETRESSVTAWLWGWVEVLPESGYHECIKYICFVFNPVLKPLLPTSE